jgi:hypothetical protein
MVAAWLKIATPVLKTLPASKKQRPHRQNVLSEHQNASTADATTGAWGILQEALESEIALPNYPRLPLIQQAERLKLLW